MGNIIDFLEYKRIREAKSAEITAPGALRENPEFDDLFDHIFTRIDELDQAKCGDDPLSVTMSVNEWIRLYNGVVDAVDAAHG